MLNSDISILSDWDDELKSSFLDNNSLGIALFSISGELLFANSAMFSLCPEFNSSNFLHPTFNDILSRDISGGIIYSGLLTIGKMNNVNTSVETKIFRKGNNLLLIGGINVAGLIDQNKTMHFLNQKVTNLQRQLMQEKAELEKLNLKLSELNIEKNKYIGMVTHDLRSPIGTAQSFSALLIDDFCDIPDDKHLEYLAIINNRCNFSLDLIDNFLNVSKIESGTFDLKITEQDYIPFVNSSILQEKIHAAKKSQEIIINSYSNTAVFSFDANKIQQVISNLVSNAVKYSMPGTKIFIDISSDGKTITTKVRDQGLGIPNEELQDVFKPFKTTSVKATANEKSIGLGLAIVKKIIEAHKGHIEVESKVGEGTTFTFSLPFEK